MSRLDAPINVFKQRLLAGEQLIGIWNSLANPIAAEALSLVGYDWMLFDTEHSPVEIAGILPLLQAAAVGSAAHVVRPAWNDPVLIKRALDIGAQTLLIPFVQNADEAQAAVCAMRYPPKGLRGVAGSTRASRFGLAPDYLGSANEQVCCLVQIETEEALTNLEEIAQTEGVVGVFIGPSDLAASLGYLGEPENPVVQNALEDCVNRLKDINVPAGILATNTDAAIRYRKWGYQFVAAGVDTSLLVSGAKTVLQTVV
ncbi:MAG: 4-hydroxy-2-oxo-heptane-1,7-dioate aldolase [Rhizobiaceae bacterium]|nr:4-hydroxy-2-oxo-heptane-1,7-dioate aldolase [Rhizobiaceae bacterium]